MKEVRITIVMPKELKERIQEAADAAYLPCSIWCRQQLVNALPKEAPVTPIKEKPLKPKDEYEIVKGRIPEVLADNRDRWIGMKELAGLIGEPATERICWIVGRELGRENKICLTESDDKVQVMKFKSL